MLYSSDISIPGAVHGDAAVANPHHHYSAQIRGIQHLQAAGVELGHEGVVDPAKNRIPGIDHRKLEENVYPVI